MAPIARYGDYNLVKESPISFCFYTPHFAWSFKVLNNIFHVAIDGKKLSYVG
jgi:hypothetical protein